MPFQKPDAVDQHILSILEDNGRATNPCLPEVSNNAASTTMATSSPDDQLAAGTYVAHILAQLPVGRAIFDYVILV